MSADQKPDETFFLPLDGPDDPRPIVRSLVDDHDDFAHLRVAKATIMVAFRNFEKIKGQMQILGEMHIPKFNGGLSAGAFASWMLAKICGGEPPDFLMILEASFWMRATAQEREALVFHELCHAAHKVSREGEPVFDDEGNPVWEIRSHDIEEFNAVVARYGAWSEPVKRFRDTLRRAGNL